MAAASPSSTARARSAMCVIAQGAGLASVATMCFSSLSSAPPPQGFAVVAPLPPTTPALTGLRPATSSSAAAAAAKEEAASSRRLRVPAKRDGGAALKAGGGGLGATVGSEDVASSQTGDGQRSSMWRGATALLASAVAAGGAALLAQRRRRPLRRRLLAAAGSSNTVRSAATLTSPVALPTASSMPAIVVSSQSVDTVKLFGDMGKRGSLVARALDSFPKQLPMVLLSTYTAVPILSAAAAALCPNPARPVRALAAALGCLVGTVAGSFLDRAKKDAARVSVLGLLAAQFKEATTISELRASVEAARRRFGVGVGSKGGETFEDTALRGIYETLLNELLDGPEHDAADLPNLQRLKAALALDAIVVGIAHRRTAQVLASKGYGGFEDEEIRVAVNKLLFLSERAFADDEPEEARLYEMSMLRKALKISDKEAKRRIKEVSTALYQKALGGVKDQVDAATAGALAGASMAFGLPSEEAERMNIETYRQIARDLLSSGRLAADAEGTLERARGVLQLSVRDASLAFVDVAGPLLLKHVEQETDGLRHEAASAGEERFKQAAATLKVRRDELGLPAAAGGVVAAQGFLAALRSLYSDACKAARIAEGQSALPIMDKMIAFAGAADLVLAELNAGAEVEEKAVTLAAEEAPARRLYGLFLERNLDGTGGAAATPEELARVLEMTEANTEAARVEVCQPRLNKLLVDFIEESEAAGGRGAILSKSKMKVGMSLAMFRIPYEAIQETEMDVYKSRLAKVAGDAVLTAQQKTALDAARNFLELGEEDVRSLHYKAFGAIYEKSVQEAMGRDGIIAEETKEALTQLRERLGIHSEDARKIYLGVIDAKLREMMNPVKEAWEEATYTKEALVQIKKERGQDIGDDPSADGSGGALGIQESVPLEGVRGFGFMEEFSKVAEFYVRNDVIPEIVQIGASEYPVTIGNMLEDKYKEEMYGIFAWNAVTCQDTAKREIWERNKPHVGGILGLDKDQQQKVMERMVSRWCNQFIKMRMGENGKLSAEDTQTLTDWVPAFFGIGKDVTKDMVQEANKGMLQTKVLRLLNLPKVSPEDVHKLREEVREWDLELQKDLELTQPQLRSLFRVEVGSVLEDVELSLEQKADHIASSREGFGLEEEDAAEELQELLVSRCKGCLVNAVGDLLQGNEGQAVEEMQRLELLAEFAEKASGWEVKEDWEVAPELRRRLVKCYTNSAAASETGRQPDLRLLERVLQV